MAIHQLALSLTTINATFTRLPPTSSSISLGTSTTTITTTTTSAFRPLVQCMAATKSCEQSTVVRRSANYQPPIWDYDFVQSLRSDYVGDTYSRRASKLKGDVRMMLHEVVEPLDQMELVDVLQRLGLSYHFEEEIRRILNSIHGNDSDERKNENLYAVGLEFRLLRQHGYNVSQDVFNSFKDDMGNFKASLCEDTNKGMLCLYEASYLSKEGESILDEARNFTAKHLEEYLKMQNRRDEDVAATLVSHALELPLHWRMLRLEARWFIDVYERQPYMNPILLELAKLDFNMVQATHQEDLTHMSRWWRSTCLGERLSFARDRLMENFLWTVGVIFEPQFGYCRRMSTKVNALITIIDDIYDVYGTLDELETFTNVIERWDINAMDQLPDYMKICFLALFNSVNEMAYDILKEQDFHIIPYLRKAWTDLCKSYLLEAKWYYSGHRPTLQEYINNAWISISAPLILTNAYFLVTNPITKEALACLEEYPDIIRWSSMILRLADDLGTSSDELKRGDVPKSIQCYMYESGASEDDARDHIRCLVSEMWKKMNRDQVESSPFSQTFIGIAMNLARMAQCMYQHGDGHGVQDGDTKDHVLSLLIQPIAPHDWRTNCVMLNF